MYMKKLGEHLDPKIDTKECSNIYLECLICGMIDRAHNPSDFLHDHNGTVVILAFEMSIFKSVVSKAIVMELF
jgi:hypothetical protein